MYRLGIEGRAELATSLAELTRFAEVLADLGWDASRTQNALAHVARQVAVTDRPLDQR